MKNLSIYNASDFPVTFTITVLPNTGLNLNDLTDKLNQNGSYLLITERPDLIGTERFLSIEEVDIEVQ